MSLCDGRALAGAYTAGSLTRPLSLASADFDEDGVPDLVSGFAAGKGGLITVHRGNVNALWSYGEALRNGPPPAFLPGARSFSVPEAPDFIAAGDFDADGHWDIAAAHLGSDALYFLRGDGHGGFKAAQRISLAGSITAMASGEINRADGLTDLAVAVNTPSGPRVLVFESPTGALKGQPESFAISQPVTALAIGKFEGTAMNDLAVAAGNEFVVIHARDRKLSSTPEQRASVPPARVTWQKLPFVIKALTAGDFSGAGPAVAALGDDGQIHILEHSLAENSLLRRMIADAEFQPTMSVARPGKDGKPAILTGRMAPSVTARLELLRQSAGSGGPEWIEKFTIPLPSSFAQALPRLVTARITGSLEEDIVVPDSGNGQLHVFSTISKARRRGMTAAELVSSPASMRLLASLDVQSAPAAVLPMRLNKIGLQGLALLQSGQSAPVVIPQTIPPANIFTVTNTSDTVIVEGTEFTGPPGSLRAAIYNANNATGEAEVVFNIPTSDPGYNATTSTFLIQPLSEAAPGALNSFALPPINQTMIIDGYTQPGASPNTSSTSDNAIILIQIDGGKATTPGGAGLVPFDDENSTFRGLDFTGWTNPEISTGSSGATASGAEGMEANGVGDYIEGNFFGTDPTGTLATNATSGIGYGNRIGIFADNGPAFGNMAGGTIIGGTTLQARNILSNNTTGGVLFLSTALQAHLEGNFIGLDATGAKILPNIDDGAGSNGPTITIGGTLPGDGNVISGNGTNVDFNDLTNGGAASDSIVQGNLIGTDATGTIGIAQGAGAGASIVSGPTDETVGGTTPAARNVISGVRYGVYIFNDTTNNVIQGNFIGTDITGTVAVANSQQGFLQGATDSTQVPATNTILGGSVAGAGNLISGNTLDGVSISGTAPGGPYETNQGSVILGNYIGTDVTGTKALGNGATGISLLTAASSNVIGGAEPGSGNIIAYNKSHGVLIDAAASGAGTGNNTIGNMILSNGGAGVDVASGTENLISENSIYQNAALGIVLGASGPPLANQACSSTATGANNLENYPTLTGGAGSLFITATATDTNGNTSEFSNAVPATTSGGLINLVGSFIGNQPSTNYTLEFFSSPTADPSGYGQGQTYLGSTQVTTGSNCTVAVNTPLSPDDADMSIALSNPDYELQTGPDFGDQVYTASVTNLGPATAHNVVVTDVLPSSLEFSSLYCDVGPCQLPITTSAGNCTATGQTVTCNLGTMTAGQTATVNIPVQALATGSITDTATVAATETDPVLSNNSSTVIKTSTYPQPFIDFPGNGTIPNFVPSAAIAGSADLPVTIYGTGFIPSSVVSFNGTTLPTVSFVDNQMCGFFSTYYCAGIEVVVPAALLTTVGTPNIAVTNPDPGPGNIPNVASTAPFTIASACAFIITPSPDFANGLENDGTTLIAENVSVGANAASCSWTASSTVAWVVPLESTPISGAYGSLDFAVAPNSGASPRSGSITVAGQTVTFTQAGGSTCDYALGSTSGNFSAAGGAGSVNVTPNSSSCAPFVVSFAPWITVPESSGLLLNNQPATYTVAANTGAARTGAIMIGGYVYTVNQSSPPCSYTLTPGTALWGAAGGAGSFAVAASSPGCAWTATSSDTSVVSVTSGASGTGNGAVNYSVAVNNNGPQTPAITVADTNGGSSAFAISQASNYTCTFTIAPSPVSVPADGTSNFFVITASNSFCQWTAASSAPSALSLTLNSSGTGTSAIYYAVAQNTSTQARVLTITAGCEIFTVNQAGAAASNPIPAITSLQPSGTTAGSAAFTLTVNGSGFINGSVVNFNGNTRTTTYVNANQLTAAILATDVASVGTLPVTVFNPNPGGGTSNAVSFNITAATTAPVATLTASLAFPGATVNTTSTPLAATLSNTGNATLNIGNIAIGGTNPSAFAIATGANACGTTLAASASCSIYVTFTPAAAQAYSATLTVADNATPTTQSAALTGTGTATAAPTATLTSTLAFPGTTVGTTSSALIATLANTGNATLDINSITIAGANPADFAETSTCGETLAAGSTCSISVTFTPALAESFSASLQVADNASGSPQTASLSGTGTTAAPASFSVSSSTAAQTIHLGGTASYSITVAAQGGAFSNAVSLTASGLPTGATAAFSPASITPGATSATSTLAIQTGSTTTAGAKSSSAWPMAALALVSLLFLPGKRRRRWITLSLLLAASLGALTACGGGFALTQAPQTYTVTVTGTSGTDVQSTTVQLTVQ